MYRALPRLRNLMAMAAMTAAFNATAAPMMEQGIQIGDVTDGRAIIWSRADRASRMMVEYALDGGFTAGLLPMHRFARLNTEVTVAASGDGTQLRCGQPLESTVSW